MDHHATSPAAAADRYPAGPLDALDAVDAAFRLLTAGPRPLAVHASRLARGLPDRPVPLDELRVLLLHPATGAAARNTVWAELVRRARTRGPEWVIGLTGIALPGLRRAVASLAGGYRGDPGDLQSEVLTGFLAAVRGLDLDDLEQVPLASRLCWAAFRAGRALAFADAGYAARRRDLDDHSGIPERPWGHPDFVLAAAVRKRVLTRAQAELIGRNRLEGVDAGPDRRRARGQPRRLVQPAQTSRESPHRRHPERISVGLNSQGRVKNRAGNRISVSARGYPAPRVNSRGAGGPQAGCCRIR